MVTLAIAMLMRIGTQAWVTHRPLHAPASLTVSRGQRSQEQLLCHKAKHLARHLKDATQFDAILFLTAAAVHAAAYHMVCW